MTTEEIISFAKRFDPRPQVLDEKSARESVLGGLIGSGAHAFAIWTRFALDSARANEPIAIVAGLGSELRMAARKSKLPFRHHRYRRF